MSHITRETYELMSALREKTEANRDYENFHEDMNAITESAGLPDDIGSMFRSLAWEHGHSSGYSEVVNVMDQYLELAIASMTAGKNAR